MKISTKPYTVSRNEYFAVFMKYYLSRAWWMLLILLGIFALNLYQQPDNWFIPSIMILFVVLFVFAIWRSLGSSANKTIFQVRQFHFEKDSITAVLEDGKIGTQPLNSIQFVSKTEQYYLLFVKKTMFYYVPKSVFESAEDLQAFEKLFQFN